MLCLSHFLTIFIILLWNARLCLGSQMLPLSTIFTLKCQTMSWLSDTSSPQSLLWNARLCLGSQMPPLTTIITLIVRLFNGFQMSPLSTIFTLMTTFCLGCHSSFEIVKLGSLVLISDSQISESEISNSIQNSKRTKSWLYYPNAPPPTHNFPKSLIHSKCVYTHSHLYRHSHLNRHSSSHTL